jgi:valyl-tRNA synthetase
MPLEKAFSPKEVEEKWYTYWEQHSFFHAQVNSAKTPYTIMIPPPNITGILHMGHVLNNTIQDVFIRWKRMQGYEALWMPGTDHAGIATQNVVEKNLAKEGKTRHDLGREKFIERVWEWRNLYGDTIIKQLKKLGASCDWDRERFTMDEGLSEAVQEIFIRLYNKGLIYRGKYIVNWCPKDHTAISDDEVNHFEQQTNLWHLRYRIKGTDTYAIVATTRPETMPGDTGIAVHPKDERYMHLIGKMVELPLANREIPIVADEVVDPAFGTGMVKITPAHDPNDYWIATRYNERTAADNAMPFINIFDISAKLNDNVPEKYRGLDRYEARKVVVKDLEELGVLVKAEPYIHSVGKCYRCDTVIEPYLSDQWFVKMKPLAERALAVVQDGTITFYPERWVKTYENWMVNIRDWCISRQLWWGHRIPIWYCVDLKTVECSKPTAARTNPGKCPHCGSTNLRQDEDVLDTWFSSWLWPSSTLGWPKDNPDLRYFYSTDTLVTGPDIIFFWVARMIMAGLEVMDEIPLLDGSKRTKAADLVPFKNVYFTSIIRDEKGRKMSKSLGNSPDPLDVIDQFGADALRFTISYLAPLGQDVLYSNEKCEIGRNFANKIWNACRFLLMNKEQLEAEGGVAKTQAEAVMDLADKWITSRLHTTIREVNASLDKFEITQATKIVYDFFWHDYCDWYVEMLKGRLYGEDPAEVKKAVLDHALSVFESALLLLHPMMPFVTEELWQNIASRPENASIMVAPFPAADAAKIDPAVEKGMAFVQNIINSVRNIRGELNVPPSKELSMLVRFPALSEPRLFEKYDQYFRRLARITGIQALSDGERPAQTASAVVEGGEIFIPLAGLIDPEEERARIRKEIDRVQGLVVGIKKKLSNESFIAKAPANVVGLERTKLETFHANLEKLQKNLEAL